jgi:dihydrofolate reductase
VILTGDVVDEVARLKEQDGRDPVVYCHGPLGQTLLDNGLLDEVRLSIHPIIVAAGALFFRDGSLKTRFELVDANTIDGGIVVLTYRPAISERTLAIAPRDASSIQA